MANGKKSNNKTTDETEEVVPSKLKKEFDIDPVEAIAPDKADDIDAIEDPENPDEESDGPELDDEELNPFKDKWEE